MDDSIDVVGTAATDVVGECIEPRIKDPTKSPASVRLTVVRAEGHRRFTREGWECEGVGCERSFMYCLL